MILLGLVLLSSAIGLIWFRTPLTGTPLGDGDEPFSLYIVNEAGQETLLWIGGLIGLLGIALIFAGLMRPRNVSSNATPSPATPNEPEPSANG